jgi:hypothetical protein
VALIEGQKPCFAVLEAGGHEHQIGVHGEVRQAAPELKERLPGIAIVLVLRHGVLDRLPFERRLQLRRDDRQPVDEQHQVETIVVLPAVVNLPHHAQDVGLVQAGVFFVERGFGVEIGEVEVAAEVVHALPQDIQGAALFDLVGQTLQEPFLGLLAVLELELFPGFCLGGVEELEERVGVEAEGAVVTGVVAGGVAVGRQVGEYSGFEVFFGGIHGWFFSGMRRVRMPPRRMSVQPWRAYSAARAVGTVRSTSGPNRRSGPRRRLKTGEHYRRRAGPWQACARW